MAGQWRTAGREGESKRDEVRWLRWRRTNVLRLKRVVGGVSRWLARANSNRQRVDDWRERSTRLDVCGHSLLPTADCRALRQHCSLSPILAAKAEVTRRIFLPYSLVYLIQWPVILTRTYLPAISISQASLAASFVTLTHSPAPHPPESSQGNSGIPPFVVLQLAITQQPRHRLSGRYLKERSKLCLYTAAVYAIADLPVAGFNLNLDN